MQLSNPTTTRSQRNAAGEHHGKLIKRSAVGCSVYGVALGITKKRLIISALLLLHICALGCVWLLKFDSIVMKHKLHGSRQGEERRNEVTSEHRIHFITKASVKQMKIKDINWTDTKLETLNVYKDFVIYKMGLLNESSGEEKLNPEVKSSKRWKLCFREGTLNESEVSPVHQETESVAMEQIQTCQCQAEWHGKDCGQPEVIWRTLLTAKRAAPFLLHRPMTHAPHRLIYMLNGYFFSLDILELQIKTVAECVDYFIINIIDTKVRRTRIKAIERRLKSILKSEQYLINHCGRPTAFHAPFSNSCSPKQAYNSFKYAISQGKITATKSTDIFLFTNDFEILNRKALKFVKYYHNANSPMPNRSHLSALQFRLKHVVYGFYWQHPKRTHVSGFLSSFADLDNSAGGDGDPSLFLHRIVNTTEIPAIIIGDLNHFGGWYCEYCQQPSEIIDALYTTQTAMDRDNVSLLQFPNMTKNRQIDTTYVQKLIAQGQVIDDNRLKLLKLRSYSDKYYAPEYAQQCSWKFGNLLLNLHASIEENIDDEYK